VGRRRAQAANGNCSAAAQTKISSSPQTLTGDHRQPVRQGRSKRGFALDPQGPSVCSSKDEMLASRTQTGPKNMRGRPYVRDPSQ
jgi:hypothetical protein